MEDVERFDPKKYGVNVDALNSLKGFSFRVFRELYDCFNDRITSDYVSCSIVDFLQDCVLVQYHDDGSTGGVFYHELLSHVEDTVCKNAIHRFMGAVKKHRKLADSTEHDVYRLEDPRYKVTFYVGLSCDAQARYLQHIQSNSNNPEKDAVIDDIKADGLLPDLYVIERIKGRYYASRREAYWIKYYFAQGEPLTNRMYVEGVRV